MFLRKQSAGISGIFMVELMLLRIQLPCILNCGPIYLLRRSISNIPIIGASPQTVDWGLGETDSNWGGGGADSGE